jgi:hypothetical protein
MRDEPECPITHLPLQPLMISLAFIFANHEAKYKESKTRCTIEAHKEIETLGVE